MLFAPAKLAPSNVTPCAPLRSIAAITRPPARLFRFAPLLLAAAIIALFAPSLQHEFTPMDDDVNIEFNPPPRSAATAPPTR